MWQVNTPRGREKYAASNSLLKEYFRRLDQYMIDYRFNKNADVSMLESKLRLLDPQNVIERGYAVVTQKDKIVSSVNKVEMDKELTITLKDGIVSAYPEKIHSSSSKNSIEKNNIEKILK